MLFPLTLLHLGSLHRHHHLPLNPLGGHLGFGEGVIVTFLRGFFLTTAFFVAFAVAFAVAFGETVGLAVAFAVVLAVGLGVAFVVAA